ncbi:hypothetical protein OJAV_G00050570 [Oryzias javanicus]|uniref:Uncharacterized protein n=1 Tax=Oryzias javanicus TaxID=123683 RepID=A0A3S2N0Y2_ORYJA|nr:hypothetical protein OJAV_G00050570 [Oryzias javanicus]
MDFLIISSLLRRINIQFLLVVLEIIPPEKKESGSFNAILTCILRWNTPPGKETIVEVRVKKAFVNKCRTRAGSKHSCQVCSRIWKHDEDEESTTVLVLVCDL